ncbi:MAG: flavodoxin [Spirochaetae bacterium HGW-Spirochaetae-3]|jgi:flavodoxin|nr:MAG: flavodoxin [Spirochaetae bacterium HGW-Spirochaetae-3]
MFNLVIVSFAACEGTGAKTASAEPTGSRILVAYFSMPESAGVDAVAGASRVVADGKVYGNTQWVADRILEATGGDRFVIETAQEYPGEHAALVDRGADEKERNARPRLKTSIGTLDAYDVVFIGYPIWWADLPMPLYSFFDEHDFSGKMIIPFSTHGGSGFADTISTIAALEPKAAVARNGFTVSRNSVSRSGGDVAAWVRAQRL